MFLFEQKAVRFEERSCRHARFGMKPCDPGRSCFGDSGRQQRPGDSRAKMLVVDIEEVQMSVIQELNESQDPGVGCRQKGATAVQSLVPTRFVRVVRSPRRDLLWSIVAGIDMPDGLCKQRDDGAEIVRSVSTDLQVSCHERT